MKILKGDKLSMRDVKRIPKILNELEKYWTQYPDLRFFQMLSSLRLDNAPKDLFFYEDDDFLEKLKDINNA